MPSKVQIEVIKKRMLVLIHIFPNLLCSTQEYILTPPNQAARSLELNAA